MSDKTNPSKQPTSLNPKGNNFIQAPQQAQIRQNNPAGNMRPPQSNFQQQQQQPPATNNSGNNAINRPSSTSSNTSNNSNGPSSHNDFMTFLNSANANNNNNNSNNNNLNGPSNIQTSGQSVSSSSPNANALSRLETIRQYYMQLSNNLRLITQQLQSPDLTASRRQALLMEQARANAAMQEFTEKILKPISASKQQQAQAQVQAQQMNSQRPPNYTTPNTLLQFQNRPPQSQPQTQVKPATTPLNYQSTPQRPPNVNLYSQSGMGMIRPIINAPPPQTPAAGSRSGGVNMNFRPATQNQPQQTQPQSQNQSMASPQRPYRPPPLPSPAVSVVPMTSMIPPSTPISSKPPQVQAQQQQQFIVNRQSYLIAAQQHQTTVAQQQVLFQQRLSVFSRDPLNLNSSPPPSLKRTASPVAQNNTTTLNKKFKPVLALPPAVSNLKTGPINPANPNQSQILAAKSKSIPSTAYTSSIISKSSSFPANYPNQVILTELAKQFNLNLTKEAENFLLKVADEFIDNLARKSFTFAQHRKRKPTVTTVNAMVNSSSNGNKSSKKQQQQSNPSQSQSQKQVEEDEELNLTIEDLILSLDEVINYQPAGNGSIENCRPLTRKPVNSGNTTTGTNSSNSTNNTNNTNMSDSTNTNSNTVNTTTSQQQQTTNHQHRLNLVKKHSSLYQQYY